MRNARNKESRNRNRTNRETATDSSRVATSDGGSVRTDAREQRQVTGGISGGSVGAVANDIPVNELSGGYSRTEIASGYYFAPNGDIKPIPDGHYIDAKDGKLKRRRNRSGGNNSDDGNEDRANYENREQTGDGAQGIFSQTDLRKPINVRGRRKKNTVSEETKKLTMVTLLASGCSAIFTSVALLTKHDHWALRNDCSPSESRILAEAINDALNTLPTKYYEQIIAIVERWIPWINLVFVLSALVFDRIEQSNKLIEESRYQPRQTSNERNADGGAQASYVGSNASLGYGQ